MIETGLQDNQDRNLRLICPFCSN